MNNNVVLANPNHPSIRARSSTFYCAARKTGKLLLKGVCEPPEVDVVLSRKLGIGIVERRFEERSAPGQAPRTRRVAGGAAQLSGRQPFGLIRKGWGAYGEFVALP